MSLKSTSSQSLTCPCPTFTTDNSKVFSCSSICSSSCSLRIVPASPFRSSSRLAVQVPFSSTQWGEEKSNIQDKNTPFAAAWFKHAVTRSRLSVLCQLFLLASSFLTSFKPAPNSSITSIYFLNTLIPLNHVLMVGSCHCKHSAETRHLLAAALGILTGYLPLFKLSKSGCFLNTIRTEVETSTESTF